MWRNCKQLFPRVPVPYPATCAMDKGGLGVLRMAYKDFSCRNKISLRSLHFVIISNLTHKTGYKGKLDVKRKNVCKIRNHLKSWIRIREKKFRIHNTDCKHTLYGSGFGQRAFLKQITKLLSKKGNIHILFLFSRKHFWLCPTILYFGSRLPQEMSSLSKRKSSARSRIYFTLSSTVRDLDAWSGSEVWTRNPDPKSGRESGCHPYESW